MKGAITLTLAAVLVAAATYARALDAGSLRVRGLADIVIADDAPTTRALNTTNLGDTNFDPLRVRLFIEGGSSSTQVFLQYLYSQESAAKDRLFGAYVLHKPLEGRELYVEAGKVPVHDGIWAAHTYSNRNPLVSVPLAYTWRSTLPSHQLPVDLDQLLASRGTGQLTPEYREGGELRGADYPTMPLLYDNCWNYGLYLLGTQGSLQYVLGATTGSPSAPVAALDTNEDTALHAKLGYGVTPGFKLYLSWARGAYLSRDVAPFLPAGRSINDYRQTLWGLSLDWQWRRLAAIGEFIHNRYETPLRADGLANNAFYLQGLYKLFPGWNLALRYDTLRYATLAEADGESWDEDVQRLEGGVNYHVNRDLVIKAVLQATDVGEGWESEYLMPALQASFAF